VDGLEDDRFPDFLDLHHLDRRIQEGDRFDLAVRRFGG